MTQKWYVVFSLVLVCGLASLNVYRAVTQSITMDEAMTFINYVDRPIERYFTNFDANNHLLHTLLCKVSILFLGPGDLSLRLPSLLAGVCYLISLAMIIALFEVPVWVKCFLLMLVALDPSVIDFMSLARGYSLSLACLMFSLWLLLSSFLNFDQLSVRGARLLLALQSIVLAGVVLSNLSYLYPAVSVGIVAVVLSSRGKPVWGWIQNVLWLSLPGLLLSLPIAWPLQYLQAWHLEYGTMSLKKSLVSIVQPAIDYDITVEKPDTWDIDLEHPSARWASLLGYGVLVWVGIVGGLCLAIWPKGRHRNLMLTLMAVTGVTFVGIVCGHLLGGLRLPLARTAMYFNPLILLMCGVGTYEIVRTKLILTRGLGLVGIGLLWGLIVRFASEIPTGEYRYWRVDADTKLVIGHLTDYHELYPEASFILGTTLYRTQPLWYYMMLQKIEWCQMVSLDWEEPDQQKVTPQFYYLKREIIEQIGGNPFVKLQDYERSGMVLVAIPEVAVLLGVEGKGN